MIFLYFFVEGGQAVSFGPKMGVSLCSNPHNQVGTVYLPWPLFVLTLLLFSAIPVL